MAFAAPPEADLQFFGDVYISKGMMKKTKTTLGSPKLFRDVRGLLESSKVNIINFEGVTGDSFVPFEMKNFLLRMPSNVPQLLADVGIHGATLANNHSLDFGYQGLVDTQMLLQESGIETTGAGQHLAQALTPMILRSGGRNICIRAFSRTLPESFWAKPNRPGTASVSFTKTRELLGECKQSGYFTVGIFHWGAELMPTPKEYQRRLAHLVIDAGADLVIGHHPHILQSVELYKNKAIFYSIGNFTFASITKGRRQEGASVRLRFTGSEKKNVEIDVVPINVNNDHVKYVPRLFTKEEQDPMAIHMPKNKRCRFRNQERYWTCKL